MVVSLLSRYRAARGAVMACALRANAAALRAKTKIGAVCCALRAVWRAALMDGARRRRSKVGAARGAVMAGALCANAVALRAKTRAARCASGGSEWRGSRERRRDSRENRSGVLRAVVMAGALCANAAAPRAKI